MQAIGVISKSRRIIRFLKNPSPCLFNSPERVNSSQAAENGSELCSPALCRHFHFTSSGFLHGNHLPMNSYCQKTIMRIPTHSMLIYAPYSTEASAVQNDSAGTAKEIYDKMLKCVVEKRTAPPNAWLWSLLEKCSNCEDIKLLFNILHRLVYLSVFTCFKLYSSWLTFIFRLFVDDCFCCGLQRLSNLRIHDNFNSALCREVTKARVRVGATDFAFVMTETGDSVSLWKIEKWRSETMKQHTLAAGFSCAKGFLLERKPENAAAIIQILNRTLSDAKRPSVMVELQKLVEVS